MQNTLTQWLAGISEARTRGFLWNVLAPLMGRYSSCALNTAGLAIKTGGSPTVKIGATDFYAIANGVLVKVAASTDMAALSGTISAGKYNVFAFFVDSGGNLSSAMGVEGTTLADVKFPQIPQTQALIGWILVTYASAFVGGTTALDTATTVYFNASTAGFFDPSALIS